jgi:hypothetical protein
VACIATRRFCLRRRIFLPGGAQSACAQRFGQTALLCLTQASDSHVPGAPLTHTGMPANANDAVALCRSLLAYTAPGVAVPVPYAALAELVELATGATASPGPRPSTPEASQTLFDVAALAERYNRAPSTVRGWFHDGLFGSPEERLFRGRGYVATSDAVHDFEERSGLCPAHDHVNIPVEADGAIVASPSELVDLPKQSRTSAVQPRLGDKILAAAKRLPGR